MSNRCDSVTERKLGILESFLIICLTASFGAPTGAAESITIASGGKGGSYHVFVENLDAILQDSEISNIESQGSVDNIARLSNGGIDYALSQNDIAHYVYYGRKGFDKDQSFSALIPLFPEYVQIFIRQDSPIKIIKDLQNKVISVGPVKSGTYQNALDVLEEVGLRENIDYSGLHLSYTASIEKLLAGEIDAVFGTGKIVQIQPDQEMKRLPIPQTIIDSLSRRLPYYTSMKTPIPLGGDGVNGSNSLSVTSYLLVNNDVPNRSIRQFSEKLIASWALLQKRDKSLPPLEESLKKEPLPIHGVMKNLLAENGYIESQMKIYWYGVIWLLILLMTLYAMRKKSSYNRIGQITERNRTTHQIVIDLIAKSGGLIVSISVVILAFSAIVVVIQWVEGAHATLMNIENRFANVDLSDGLLWIFMFITSGFTSDIFPQSTIGRIMVGMLGLVGIAGPIGLLFVGFERVRDRQQKGKKGLFTVTWSDHVLICGWNSKVPGLIYSLTGDDAPHKKHVAVIAESSLDAPLERYGFDNRYVAYVRGDSADHNTLERANASSASVAIVVAGERKIGDSNIGSILTVMALKNVAAATNKEIFVAAEMIFSENQEFFESCGVDALISSTVISNKIISLSCLSSAHLIDFILDAITYDDHDEIYSMRVSEIESKSRIQLEGRNVKELLSIFAFSDVNVIGLVTSGQRKTGLLDSKFDADSRLIPLVREEDLSHRISKDDAVVYLANNRADIHRANPDFQADRYSISDHAFENDAPQQKRQKIILVGDLERCQHIASDIRHYSCGVDPISIRREQIHSFFDDLRCSSDFEGPEGHAIDGVAILSEATDAAGKTGSLDARTILTANLVLQKIREIQPKKPRLIAEMLHVANRPLFRDAGVDLIIPEAILVERLMAKLVYNKGVISDYFMALLSTEDKTYFSSRLAQDGDTYCGRSFEEAIASHTVGEKLVAWLPQTKKSLLKNQEEDFDTHFLMCPSDDTNGQKIKSGDELVLITSDTCRPERQLNH